MRLAKKKRCSECFYFCFKLKTCNSQKASAAVGVCREKVLMSFINCWQGGKSYLTRALEVQEEGRKLINGR